MREKAAAGRCVCLLVLETSSERTGARGHKPLTSHQKHAQSALEYNADILGRARDPPRKGWQEGA
jgi:hypothetical protein